MKRQEKGKTTLTKYNNNRFKIQGPLPSDPKGNKTFEILLVKIFSTLQKTKNKSNTCTASIEKIKKSNFAFSKKVYNFFKQEIKVGKCKTKAIQADLGIFNHITVYSGIFRRIQAYSPGLLYYLIRRDTGRLAKEALTV